MARKNDPLVITYCAEAMLPHIKTLQTTAAKIHKRVNIEDIHDIRVASRRIRTCLSIFSGYLPAKKLKAWSQDIKAITKAYGAARDLDVQLDVLEGIYQQTTDAKIKSGLRRIRLRLRQRRQKKQARTKEATQSVIESPVLNEMMAWCESALASEPPAGSTLLSLYQLGYQSVQSRLDNFLFFEVFIFDPARIEEHHRMRVAAKDLRYALEVFSNLYDHKTDFALEVARKSQEYLGQIHDADVWISYLPEFMAAEQRIVRRFYGHLSPYSRLVAGFEFLLENRKRERDKIFNRFLKDWREWKMQEIWLNLRRVVYLTHLDEKPVVESHPDITVEATPAPPDNQQTPSGEGHP